MKKSFGPNRSFSPDPFVASAPAIPPGSLPLRLLGPGENASVSATKHFFNGLLGGKRPAKLSARSSAGKQLEVETRTEGETVLVRFPNDPMGACIEMAWEG